MNVPKVTFEIICLVTFLGQAYGNLDSKEYFCGKKLVRTLSELCSIYNHPTFARNRFRRQIVDECCRSQCSRRHLVQHYCLEAHSSIANQLDAKPEIPIEPYEKDTRNYQSDGSPKVEEKNSLNVGSSEEKSYKIHGKSKCRCRKRRAKRVKKLEREQSSRNLIANPVPPPNIGHVEHSQKPFYVWKLFRTY